MEKSVSESVTSIGNSFISIQFLSILYADDHYFSLYITEAESLIVQSLSLRFRF